VVEGEDGEVLEKKGEGVSPLKITRSAARGYTMR
jgi:hypothetical protein